MQLLKEFLTGMLVLSVAMMPAITLRWLLEHGEHWPTWAVLGIIAAGFVTLLGSWIRNDWT